MEWFEGMARAARKTGGELVLHIARLTWNHPATARLRGGVTAAFGVALAAAFATYNAADPRLAATPVVILTASLDHDHTTGDFASLGVQDWIVKTSQGWVERLHEAAERYAR